jgi:hypothetical protein
MAAPAWSLFRLICRIACCIPIERATALKSICIPPQYTQQASEWFGSSDPAADGPPPPWLVVVHGLMADPVYTSLSLKLVCTLAQTDFY